MDEDVRNVASAAMVRSVPPEETKRALLSPSRIYRRRI